MKLIKSFILVVFLMSIPAYAIDYKSVIVERGDKAQVMNRENAIDKGFFDLSTEQKKQWVVVQNCNPYPVKVNFEYKLGDKDAPWQSYSNVMGRVLNMEPETEMFIFLGGHIKGVKIVYVNVDKSEATKKALNAIGNLATGFANSIKTETEDNN